MEVVAMIISTDAEASTRSMAEMAMILYMAVRVMTRSMVMAAQTQQITVQPRPA
ncbi:hypothetical protein D3C77_391960 [compost metagenome]